MEKIKRALRLFFVTYGNLFLFVIGVIVIIIFVIQSLNRMATEEQMENSVNNLTQEELIIEEKEHKLEETEKEYISSFINYCNTGMVKEAYNMLSDECKQEKYSNIDEFESEYIKKIFKVNIVDYEIIKKDNKYSVILVQDILATGKKEDKIEETYQITGVLESKIYICN